MEDALAPYVDLEVARATVDRFAQDPRAARPVDVVAVLQLLRLGFFLEQEEQSRR
jgi:asparagine synthase (glutamine-hydrolysing)